ncbi:MAG: 2-keto-3-deoxygluconate permease [Dethiobacter sp.]|nr:2-keto-3-deoxygluconate permease [Dethiobacter sp.]
MTTETSRFPMFATMLRIPGGLMLIPLILGSLIGTFAGGALEIGSFTTALFQNSAMPLIALLIFATGTQVNMRTGGPILATTGTILLMKTIVPATLIVLLGLYVGLDGILGVSILAMLAAFDNSNGGLWLAYTGQYGDNRDRGAYMASAINDGPFFTLLFLGASGLGDIPLIVLVAALVPFLLGVLVGNLDVQWRDVLKPVPNIVIPFFAFALGTGINLGVIVTGGLSGLVLGLLISPITGGLVYLGYRYILRRGGKSGIGFAAGTTAGNAIATPAVVAAADPTFLPYVGTATAQIAACVLISAILAPLLASYFLKRAGELKPVDEPDLPADKSKEALE